MPAERNLANFMLFILFFPHLVAGPIVRARDFLPQIRRPQALGLGAHAARRAVLPDGPVQEAGHRRPHGPVRPIRSSPTPERTAPRPSGWRCSAYALQIYCDFSGYTDMALGTAHLLGYKLAQNFNMPYLAANVAEFWRRWHISLSTWLRDYLFIPLGGSRGSSWQTYRNLLITMTLGGLWHGASWTFVVWGLLHGLLLIVHRSFRSFCKPRPRLDAVLRSVPGTLCCVLLTWFSVCIGWVFFRRQSLPNAGLILQRMFLPFQGMGPPLHNRSLWYLVALMAICHLFGATGAWKRWVVQLPAPVLGFGFALALTLALLLAPDTGKMFIYFKF